MGPKINDAFVHDRFTSMLNDMYYLNIRRASHGAGLLSCGLTVTKTLVAIEVDLKFCDWLHFRVVGTEAL